MKEVSFLPGEQIIREGDDGDRSANLKNEKESL